MTLEKGKSYGQEQIQQTLQDKARTRLNNPAPHQAPQRERVSRAQLPPSARSGGSSGRGRNRRWKALIRPDVNMGVPTLMMILEPNIVWDHVKTYVPAVGREVEATITPGEFFEGWHKGGRRAHGVYEGSYWELIGDCDELAEMLRKMSRAPALLEEPDLDLPPPPELPSWDDFKPNLHLIPAAPSLPTLKLPPFRAPILEPEPPFVEPEYLPVPVVPPVPKEEPLPIFIPPEFVTVDPLVEPAYIDPDPPVMPEAPRPPAFGQPKHGYDWTGDRPFQIDPPSREGFVAQAAQQRVMDTSRFVHPPKNLPPLPEVEPLDVDLLKGLDLDPIPKLELAWMGGPEPDPPYASVPSSPAALSRHSSRIASAPPSRPLSAVPAIGGNGGGGGGSLSGAAGQPSPALSSRPRSSSAYKAGSPAGTADGEAGGTPQHRIRSARRVGSGLGSRQPSLNAVRTPEEVAWEEARSVVSEASGTPRMWLNFNTPFAELPPIMMPPRPEPGPEPLPEEFPHETLEELPPFHPPAQLEVPPYSDPPTYVPAWAPPCEPRPVGFLRGSAPVIICDVSGTMNPRQQGRFRELKRCAVDLLDPEGEVATAAAGFDVITFAGSAWSWSAGYGERMGLLQSSQVPYSGRQVGGKYSAKLPPGAGGGGSRSGSPERIGGPGGASSRSGGLSLLPTSPDMLSDAQRWVANWPEAVGQTNLLNAFLLAQQHAGADCWYILSDGLAHDQQACLEFLGKRVEAGLPLPVIHAVGFMPAEASVDTSGERFLRGIAELTGGSYQRYTPDIAKVWINDQGFVRVDLRNERPEQREERQWAERQLRAERIKNLRLSIMEPLEATMQRVMALHHQQRVLPAVRANEVMVGEARRRHASAVESVRITNERRLAEATAAYDAAVADTRARNQARVDAAREAFLGAHAAWERDYLDRLQDWEESKAFLERQREEQLAAMRPGSGAVPSSPAHRPTSATRLAAHPNRSKSGVLLSPPHNEASEARAAYAAAEYDNAMGLYGMAEKLASPTHTPPGSRPVSAFGYGSAVGGGGSRPVSARSNLGAVDGGGGAGGGTAGGGASEYLEAIAEDLAEALAPVDAMYGRSTTAVDADGIDDDGLDVRPSTAGRGGDRGGRDQDGGSAGGSRRSGSATASRPASSSGDAYRPLSARGGGGGGGGGGRVSSARSQLGSPAAAVKGRPMSASLLAGAISGVVPLAPPPLPEPSPSLAPLRGERSDEFKRRVLPPEVVDEHDAANAARLDEIRAQWDALIAADAEANAGRKLAALRRNAARVEAYRKAVYEAYAEAVIHDVVLGGAVRVAANAKLMDNAEALYQAELARVEEENARLRALHAAEVAERRQQEELHAQAYSRWEEARDARLRQYEGDRQKARAEHDANITRLKAEWRSKKQAVLELNDARLTEAEAAYNELVEGIKETNRVLRAEHTELLRQRKEVEGINLSRLAEAKTVHKVRLEARAAENERAVKQAMEDHQALCVRLSEEYEQAKVQAEADHTELCAFLRAANEQLTEEARRRFQEALAEVQSAYDADCVVAREAHERDLERVRRYNQEIWPKVHVARLAQAELARVQAFAEHIRFCANKFEMGINLMPNTPNYDRVVEMQALTEALGRAFPDMSPSALPWPEHERRLEPGTGWVAAPVPRPCSYRDPADTINRIAKGKSARPGSAGASPSVGASAGGSPGLLGRARSAGSQNSSGGGAGPATAGPGATDPEAAAAGVITMPGSVDESPYSQQIQPYTPPRHLSRPLSAGRARFAGVLSGDAGGGLAAAAAASAAMTAAAAAAGGGMRPMSAAVIPSSVAGRVEAWAAATLSALSSPGGGGGGAGTAAGGGAAGAAYLRPQSAAGGYHNPSAWRRSNTAMLRAGSARNGGGGNVTAPGGPTLGGAAAAAAAATAAMGSPGALSRPVTARAGTGPGAAILPLGPSRPRSAGAGPRPARVAVDVQPLQASVARSKAQAGAHLLTSAALAGFARDVPKLRYPEVDVQQPLTLARGPPPAPAGPPS